MREAHDLGQSLGTWALLLNSTVAQSDCIWRQTLTSRSRTSKTTCDAPAPGHAGLPRFATSNVAPPRQSTGAVRLTDRLRSLPLSAGEVEAKGQSQQACFHGEHDADELLDLGPF